MNSDPTSRRPPLRRPQRMDTPQPPMHGSARTTVRLAGLGDRELNKLEREVLCRAQKMDPEVVRHLLRRMHR